MLDLSPEKLMMLLVVGLVVLGPNKLPAAARSLAHGLARARQLAATLTDPITTTLVEPIKTSVSEPLRDSMLEPLRASTAEPRRALDHALEGLRSTIASHPLPGAGTQPPHDPSLN